MPSGFTMKIVAEATHRVVPEDSTVGAGINVPYRAADAGISAASRMDLRAGGWAQYDEAGVLEHVHVPDGWRLELWGDMRDAEELTFESVAALEREREK